jgi:hypothetical protein
MGIYEKITKILAEEESELTKLAANVLRVLLIYHGVCWRTELPEDLIKFYRTMEEFGSINLDLLDKAINYLEAEGMILVEYRKRGELLSKEVYVDKLIKLKDFNEVSKAFQRDEAFIKYRFKRAEAIKRALGEK